MSEKCSFETWRRGFKVGCGGKVVKDGLCKRHQPEAVRERQMASIRKYEAKVENSPKALLRKERELTKELSDVLIETLQYLPYGQVKNRAMAALVRMSLEAERVGTPVPEL